MLFIIHLLRKGLVTVDQVWEAVERQQRSRKPLGRLALEQGKLTVAQVFKILAAQTDTCKPFGRIAVELGYFDEADLAYLLLTQSDNDRPVEEILVESGVITADRMELERRAFREHAAKMHQVHDLVEELC